MLMQNFAVRNKQHYGMLWYFLEWSILKAASAAAGARDGIIYSYMQMLINKIPAIDSAHLALAIFSLRVKIDVWTGPNNRGVSDRGVSFVWFHPSVIQQSVREIYNQYMNKIETRINTQMMTGLLNKTLPVFLRIKKFHTLAYTSGWAELPRPYGDVIEESAVP